MILNIIVTIFSILGIYGFYNESSIFLYVGMTFVILEYIIGFITGDSKGGLLLIVIPFVIGFVINGMNLLQAIAVCLCFEHVIFSILGLILTLFFSNILNKRS